MKVKTKNSKTRSWKLPVLNTAHLAALNIFKTDNMLSRAITKHLAEFDLTISQHSVLGFLQANSEYGLALNALGELLSLSSPNITSVVDRLEEKGLVVRTNHSSDRRIKIIKLTPKGEELERRVFALHGDRIREMMGALTEEEMQTLIQILRKLRFSLQESGWAT